MKTEIMVVDTGIGLHHAISSSLNDSPAWNVSWVTSDEEAIEKFQQIPVELIVFTTALSEAVKNKLRKLLSFQNDEVLFVEYDPTGDALHDVISNALNKRNTMNASYTFTDNAFKHAVINICLS